MRVETRIFKKKKFLALIPESNQESTLIDSAVGEKGFPIQVKGEVRLSGGQDHYILLERSKYHP